jgi:uncharacterized membrane protein
LAGPAAQRFHNPRSWRSYHGALDHELALGLAFRLTGSAASAAAYMNWLEIVAQEMVERSWKPIERVAAALIKNGSLSGPEVLWAIEPQRKRVSIPIAVSAKRARNKRQVEI